MHYSRVGKRFFLETRATYSAIRFSTQLTVLNLTRLVWEIHRSTQFNHFKKNPLRLKFQTEFQLGSTETKQKIKFTKKTKKTGLFQTQKQKNWIPTKSSKNTRTEFKPLLLFLQLQFTIRLLDIRIAVPSV